MNEKIITQIHVLKKLSSNVKKEVHIIQNPNIETYYLHNSH